MKRRLLSVLFIVLLLLAAGCKKDEKKKKTAAVKVLSGRMTALPDYSLPENATADEMRKTAIKAMRDGLSVQWYPENDFQYMKAGTSSKKVYKFSADKIYCGLPYTNGDSSILHWLQYYDLSTGKLDKSILDGQFYKSFGNACATAVMWGWNAVCPDMKWDSCSNMTPQNGCIPVEGFKYPYEITTYSQFPTKTICNENGEQTMYKSYTNLLPADAVMTYSYIDNEQFNHVMMVTDKPHVEYNPDGSIDGEKSFVLVQDQRAGHTQEKYPYLKTENGEKHQYSGRIDYPVTFAELFKSHNIPLTCAQFLGKTPYVKATASLDGDAPADYNSLSSMTVRSNYNIVSVSMTVTDKKAKKQVSYKKYVRINNWWNKTKDKDADKEYALTYVLNNQKDGISTLSEVSGNLVSGNVYTVKIDVLVATGQTLTAFNGDVTG